MLRVIATEKTQSFRDHESLTPSEPSCSPVSMTPKNEADFRGLQNIVLHNPSRPTDKGFAGTCRLESFWRTLKGMRRRRRGIMQPASSQSSNMQVLLRFVDYRPNFSRNSPSLKPTMMLPSISIMGTTICPVFRTISSRAVLSDDTSIS